MSLKVKLITSISAFFLVLSLLVTGVFAAQNLAFSFGGTINFEGINGNIDALITAEVTGTATPITLDDISIEQGDTEVTVPISWQNINFNFNENGSIIALTITIQNRREDRGLNASLSVSGLATISNNGTNVYGGFEGSGYNNYASSKEVLISPNQSKSVSIDILVDSLFAPVDNVNVSFTISFQDRAIM